MECQLKPVRLINHEEYKDMYRLEYDDGVISEEFYNLSRANDILNFYDFYVKQMDQRVEIDD